MTQTGYTNVVVNTMLGWLKTVASWILRFFNLYSGVSPIDFLAKNWWKLLAILLAIGIVTDLIVWVFRWRPHWVWFGKKRVVINDKNFFVGEEFADNDEADALRGRNIRPKNNWVDNDFVVKSSPRKRTTDKMEADAQQTDVFSDESFNVDAKHRFVDRYEDEVFNVENLPEGNTAPKKSEGKKTGDVRRKRKNMTSKGKKKA